jgi:hypothetical protein
MSQSGLLRLSTEETLIYSGHEKEGAPHTQRFGFMLSRQAAAGAHPCGHAFSLRGNKGTHRPVLYTNKWDEQRKDFFDEFQSTINQKKGDIFILMGDINTKTAEESKPWEKFMKDLEVSWMKMENFYATFVLSESIFLHKNVHNEN